MKLRLAEPACAEDEAEAMFERAEFALDGGAAPVEAAPLVGSMRDGEQRGCSAFAERDDRGDLPLRGERLPVAAAAETRRSGEKLLPSADWDRR